MLACVVQAADKPVQFEAMMILASNDSAPLDRRLERVEFQLRRMFRFEYYRHMGSGQASAILPSKFTLDLGHGHQLAIDASGKGDRIRSSVVWYRDGKSVLNTAVGMKPGSHAILGGIPYDGGTLIITLVAR